MGRESVGLDQVGWIPVGAGEIETVLLGHPTWQVSSSTIYLGQRIATT